MNRKWFGFTGAVLLISALTVGAVLAAAANPIKIIVNGEEIKPGIEPKMVQGTVMAPVRTIAESLGANVAWDGPSNAVIITVKDKTSKPVAEIPGEGITLSALERDGRYEDFTLEVGESKRFFDWKNVSNPTYAPELLLADMDQDGQKELIVIVTTGYGTGVHRTEAHVINRETLQETYIDNPKAILLKNVKTGITEKEVEIAIGGQKTTIDREKIDIEPAHLFSEVVFGNVCKFEADNDGLRVSMGAQISPAGFIGEVQISYIVKDNMYQANKIEFIRYDN